MKLKGQGIRALIVMPEDLVVEKSIINSSISKWNEDDYNSRNYFLRQFIWNEKIYSEEYDKSVENCNILIGVFWHKLENNSGTKVSKTEKVIEQFLNSYKHVMLFFSQSPPDPSKITTLFEYPYLKKFEDKMGNQMVAKSYNGYRDFEEKFCPQLEKNLFEIIMRDEEDRG